MVKGQLPHQKYYIISDETQKGEGGDDIQIVPPTQLAVAQAKMAVKRKMDAISLREKGEAKKKKLLKNITTTTTTTNVKQKGGAVKKAVKKPSTSTAKESKNMKLKDKVVKTTKTKVKKTLIKRIKKEKVITEVLPKLPYF